jgi:hypothetical protein
MLLNEQKELISPSVSCWGLAICVLPTPGDPQFQGNRALVHGGWTAHGGQDGINHKLNHNQESGVGNDGMSSNCMVVLDCEQVTRLSMTCIVV